MDTTILAEPELYVNNLHNLVLRMSNVSNASCKRHYARILMHLTASNAPVSIKQTLQKTDMEAVIEKCFDWLIDSKVKVAVKVCAIETLYNLSTRYTWITEELPGQIQFMLREGSPAIQARGKKILNLIDKQKAGI
jgi:hypothetical protein